MRSAAAFAAAREEVAQVRYSSSGNTAGSRRPNHDLDTTGNSASAWATLSTASKECSAPVPAKRTSKMPGVIWASIFSPRPGRGYRFHSLHFEIIAVFLSKAVIKNFYKSFSPEPPFVLQSECLNAQIRPET